MWHVILSEDASVAPQTCMLHYNGKLAQEDFQMHIWSLLKCCHGVGEEE